MKLQLLKNYLFIIGGAAFLLFVLLSDHYSCCFFASNLTPAGRDGKSMLFLLGIGIAAIGYGITDINILNYHSEDKTKDFPPENDAS